MLTFERDYFASRWYLLLYPESLRISTNIVQGFSKQLTFGQKMAGKVATFAGSWTFILI